ncbi:Mobile element protein [Bacillus thermotolerans]|uniref:Mobile element protein n=1 Tax=Bacillus thermotolerans TaxID=1221996 RepID=A0A0F5I1F9_BACTR|nr:Mobile element protein [Bacillus thermotolerans]
MISNQESLNFSPFMALYDIVVPKDNMLRKINELVDFNFILEELKTKYCLDNGPMLFRQFACSNIYFLNQFMICQM